MKAAQRPLGRVVATVELPTLPPSVLGKNSHAHWRTKGSEFKALKDFAIGLLWEGVHSPEWPYAALTMHVEWRQAGRMTDADAVLARLSAVMDAAETVGLVVNDGDIDIGGIRRARVKHKADQRVVVQFVEGG